MPAKLYLSGPCKICGQETSGRHFGVLSCRACAAFFRRAASLPKNKLECSGSCTIVSDGKFECKSCRLKRCFDVGMNASKFQNNRDLISCSSQFKKRASVLIGPPESLSTFLGRPAFILCCEPDKAAHENTFLDFTNLLNTAQDMIRKDTSIIGKRYQSSNSLEQLSMTLSNMRLRTPAKKIIMIRKFGKEESIYIWEETFLRAVEWFVNFHEFNELDEFVKLEIIKSVWSVWARLEKLAETADHQRKQVFGETVIMCGNGTCLDSKSYEIDLSWCTNYSMEQLAFFIQPEAERNLVYCIQELIKLAPSNIELNYMLLQISLNHAGKTCQEDVLEATEKLLESQANHLHNYYVKKMKNPNYSARLVKLMKVNQAIEADMRDRKEKNHIARVFNIMKIDFSHPDMFEGY